MNLEEFGRHFLSTFPSLVDSKIVVALSGGADSVALLHLLHTAGPGLTLLAAHIHHGTRGLEADGDAAFCERLCTGLAVPFVLRRLPLLPSGPEGREATWRRARYTALRDVASSWGADAIATGHQRDDVAEGVLVQLLRGTGPRAMAGIAASQGDLIRPLLPWSHGDLSSWLDDHGIAWREDSSNTSRGHLRNRVRHDALGVLETISPAIRRHLVRLARALAVDEAYLASELERHARWIDPWHPAGGVTIHSIAALDPALRIRWLHAQAKRCAVGRVTHRQGELLQPLLTGEIRAMTLAGRWVLRRASGCLWLEPPHEIPPFERDLEPGRTIDLPIPGWAAAYCPAAKASSQSTWRFPCPPGLRLTLRSARADDRFADGPTVHALLKREVPRHLRRSWPILCKGAKILWIPGVVNGTGSDGGEWIVEVKRT